MTFQMQAFNFKRLLCPECGQELLVTKGQFADLYEHLQEESNLKDSDIKQEDAKVNMEVKYSGFKAEVGSIAETYAVPKSKYCKNNGKYLVLKRTVVFATSL